MFNTLIIFTYSIFHFINQIINFNYLFVWFNILCVYLIYLMYVCMHLVN